MSLKLPDYEISAEILAKLDIYSALLKKWQSSVNLVSPSSLENLNERHFSDSLQLISLVSREAKVLDLGSGAGFPGLVLAIAISRNVTLVESDQKKCQFLKAVSREAKIDVDVYNGRIESFEYNRPDYIVSRALADLSHLLKLTEKWWSRDPSLNLIFLKGQKSETEILEAKKDFDFKIDMYQSRTDISGRILRLTDIRKIS